MVGAKVFVHRLSAFMPLDGGVTPPPTNPVERGLADLWRRTVGPMAMSARRRFRGAVESMVQSWLWELANHIQNRIPDPVDYIEMRRRTFVSDMIVALAQLALVDEVPPEIFRTRPMSGLTNSAHDYAGLLNDVFSYQKEIELEGEIHNGVLVIQKFLGCDKEQAVAVVNDLMTARARQFEHTVAAELPVLFDEHNLDAGTREKLKQYVKKLEQWMAGILIWHRGCQRYQEPVLLKSPTVGRLLHGPTGLGTSAARIESFRGGRPPVAENLPLHPSAGADVAPHQRVNLQKAQLQGVQSPSFDVAPRQGVNLQKAQLKGVQTPSGDVAPHQGVNLQKAQLKGVQTPSFDVAPQRPGFAAFHLPAPRRPQPADLPPTGAAPPGKAR
jgi:germacradienol/geosmin synthase